MDRRAFLAGIGLAPALAVQLACAASGRSAGVPLRRLRRVGLQLYSLRDDARRDLDGTLAAIANIGYSYVELLGSMDNFGTPAERLRALLDRHGLRAPSTHVAAAALDELEQHLDDAQTLGHDYLTVASLRFTGRPTLDEYRRWADRFNEAGRRARERGIWLAFHNHASDMHPIDGASPYDLFVERTDPTVVRHQLDTGNCAMAGIDPLLYMQRFGARYWLFHLKDVPQLGATSDTELGRGVIDFNRLLAAVEHIDQKLLFVEQETYPGAPLESVHRDYEYISRLEF